MILNLGALDISADKYKELANCIEAMLSGQLSLFSPDPQIAQHAQQAVRSILEKKSKEHSDDIFNEQKSTPEPEYQNVDVPGKMSSDHKAAQSRATQDRAQNNGELGVKSARLINF